MPIADKINDRRILGNYTNEELLSEVARRCSPDNLKIQRLELELSALARSYESLQAENARLKDINRGLISFKDSLFGTVSVVLIENEGKDISKTLERNHVAAEITAALAGKL